MSAHFARTAALLAVLAAPSLGWTQAAAPAPAAPVDVLSDVTIRVTPPPDQIDVAASRLPRLRGCFNPPDTWSRDPSAKFNQAYYEELTGQANYYDSIRLPPPKIRFHYPGPVNHPPEMFFARMDNDMQLVRELLDARLGPDGGLSAFNLGNRPTPGIGACAGRAVVEKDANFARALAMYDKGDYARALPAMEQAYARLRKSTMGGETALMIARMYMRGDGAPRDVPQAIAWLEKAVEAPGADGRGYPRYNPDQPDRYYNIASEAATALSLIYITGNGVPKDEAAARAWTELAMRNQHVPAMKVAADMYYAGYGGRKNLRDALMRYEVAGEVRHAGALFSAAEMRDLGEGASPDRKKALRLYAMSAQLGDAAATYALAVAYDKGDGVPADPDRALTLYKIAAVGKNPAAETAIGVYFYEGGSALGKDHEKARAWFQEAALRGDAGGMVNLAAMLIKGEGGEADQVRAWAWLTLAREGGRGDVAAGIAGLEARMKPGDLAAAKALIGPEGAPNS